MLRGLFRVVRHSAVAFVVSSALGALVLSVVALGGLPGREAASYPYRVELRLSELALPAERTAPLLADVARDLPGAADVAIRPDGTWLIVHAASDEQRRASNRGLGDLLKRHGFTRWTVRLTSPWSDRLAELAGDPLAAVARYSGLIPLLMAFGGVGFAAVAWYLRRRYPEPVWEAGTVGSARACAIGIGVGGVALAIVTGLEGITQWLGAPVQEQDWVVEVVNRGGGLLVAVFVLSVVVAPLGEELFFRGHLFRHLAARGFQPLAYFFSAGAFAAAHGNPSGLPAYLAYGVVLAWSFDRWRSLAVPIVAHATVNGVAIGLLIW